MARLSANVLEESAVGVVATHGDPNGLSNNTLLGADFQYRNSDIGNGKRLLSDWYFERSDSSVHGDDNAFDASLVYPNEPWSGELHFKQVGARFVPTLGFVNRQDIREYRGSVERIQRLNEASIRWFTIGAPFQVVTDLDDKVQSRRNSLAAEIFGNAGDQYTLQAHHDHEHLTAPFELPGGVVVPPGSYRWTHLNPEIPVRCRFG